MEYNIDILYCFFFFLIVSELEITVLCQHQCVDAVLIKYTKAVRLCIIVYIYLL